MMFVGISRIVDLHVFKTTAFCFHGPQKVAVATTKDHFDQVVRRLLNGARASGLSSCALDGSQSRAQHNHATSKHSDLRVQS